MYFYSGESWSLCALRIASISHSLSFVLYSACPTFCHTTLSHFHVVKFINIFCFYILNCSYICKFILLFFLAPEGLPNVFCKGSDNNISFRVLALTSLLWLITSAIVVQSSHRQEMNRYGCIPGMSVAGAVLEMSERDSFFIFMYFYYLKLKKRREQVMVFVLYYSKITHISNIMPPYIEHEACSNHLWEDSMYYLSHSQQFLLVNIVIFSTFKGGKWIKDMLRNLSRIRQLIWGKWKCNKGSLKKHWE